MTQEYNPDQIALIRANAAAAELQRALDDLPVAIIPSMVMPPDGKRARRSVQFAYEANGGDLKLAIWAKDNWGEFITKVWAKMVEKQPEAAGQKGIEDILDVIDAEAIDVSYEDVVEPRE